MEKLNVNNCDRDQLEPEADSSSDTESWLSENDLLFGFLHPLPKNAGYPNGAVD